MTVRAHSLEHSLRVFDRLCASGSSKLLEASCARVALDYGSRTTGLQRLGNCLNQLQQAQQVDLSEPFLVPMGRFDQLDPRGQWANWTASALLEALEISGTYSSFYTAGENRGRLEALVTLGFAGPEIERRLQLVRARFPAP
jgi:hypothetical protein